MALVGLTGDYARGAEDIQVLASRALRRTQAQAARKPYGNVIRRALQMDPRVAAEKGAGIKHGQRFGLRRGTRSQMLAMTTMAWRESGEERRFAAYARPAEANGNGEWSRASVGWDEFHPSNLGSPACCCRNQRACRAALGDEGHPVVIAEKAVSW